MNRIRTGPGSGPRTSSRISSFGIGADGWVGRVPDRPIEGGAGLLVGSFAAAALPLERDTTRLVLGMRPLLHGVVDATRFVEEGFGLVERQLGRGVGERP